MNEQLKAHMRSLYCMTAADDDVSNEELTKLYEIGINDFGLTQDEINEAVLSGGSVMYIAESDEDRVQYLYNLAKIAYSDGKINDSERLLLKKYSLLFGIKEDEADKFVDYLIDNAKNNVDFESLLK